MVAGLRSEFGPLPDQSMHEKTSVPALINEIYTFLKQADARELQHLFLELDEARDKGTNEEKIIDVTSNDLSNQKAIGWFQGRMEFGPRALGGRSILGDEGYCKQKHKGKRTMETIRTIIPGRGCC